MSSIDAAASPSGASRATGSVYERWQLGHKLSGIGIHVVLLAYTTLAMFPILITAINSFKKQGDIFGQPYTIPTGSMFTMIGYQTVFKRADVLSYFSNSLIITLGSIGLSLLLGSMAAF